MSVVVIVQARGWATTAKVKPTTFTNFQPQVIVAKGHVGPHWPCDVRSVNIQTLTNNEAHKRSLQSPWRSDAAKHKLRQSVISDQNTAPPSRSSQSSPGQGGVKDPNAEVVLRFSRRRLARSPVILFQSDHCMTSLSAADDRDNLAQPVARIKHKLPRTLQSIVTDTDKPGRGSRSDGSSHVMNIHEVWQADRSRCTTLRQRSTTRGREGEREVGREAKLSARSSWTPLVPPPYPTDQLTRPNRGWT
ncbi:hypothetical protein ElyMa_000975000 [Elysia marginata]|uniref:Uncharacterized protein n=1 Tax=Elysia marginata TaxID=1093978 RepID=A0AAV4HEP1_9GAST|nr:hypothetical protein ElyMa_000975000 [Elysia marginata]